MKSWNGILRSLFIIFLYFSFRTFAFFFVLTISDLFFANFFLLLILLVKISGSISGSLNNSVKLDFFSMTKLFLNSLSCMFKARVGSSPMNMILDFLLMSSFSSSFLGEFKPEVLTSISEINVGIFKVFIISFVDKLPSSEKELPTNCASLTSVLTPWFSSIRLVSGNMDFPDSDIASL